MDVGLDELNEINEKLGKLTITNTVKDELASFNEVLGEFLEKLKEVLNNAGKYRDKDDYECRVTDDEEPIEKFDEENGMKNAILNDDDEEKSEMKNGIFKDGD